MPFSDAGEWEEESFFDQPMGLEELTQYVAGTPAAAAPAQNYDIYSGYDQAAYDPYSFFQEYAQPPAVAAPAPAPYDFFMPPSFAAPAVMSEAVAPEPIYPEPTPAPSPYDRYTPPAPAPAPVQEAVTSAPVPAADGYWTTVGSGEDRQDVWVSNAPAPAAENQYIGKNLSTVQTPFDWGKYGFKGETSVYGDIADGSDEQGNVRTSKGVVGSTKEFDDWLASQGYQTKYSLSGTKGNQTRTDYLLDKEGRIVDTKETQIDMGGGGIWDALDTLQKIAPMVIGNLAAPGLGTALGSAVAGNAAAYGLTNFVSSGLDPEAALKAAAIAGAGSYLNPAAADVGQSVQAATESKLLGDIASGAVRGAGQSGIGALARGDSIGDALLSGALSGGVSGGVGSAVNQAGAAAGLDPATVKAIAPVITAVAKGQDPTSAIAGSLLNQGVGAASNYLSNVFATDTGDETARLLARAPDPGEKDVAEEEEAPETQTATTKTIEDTLRDAGIEPTVTEQPTVDEILSGISESTQATGPTQDELAGLDTGYRDTGVVDTTTRTQTDAGELAGTQDWYQNQGGMDDWGVTGTSGEETAADLTDQEAEDRQGVQDVLADLGDYGLTDQEAEDRRVAQEVFADIGDYGLTDQEAEDRAAARDVFETVGEYDLTDREREDREAAREVAEEVGMGYVGDDRIAGGGGGKTTGGGGGGTTATKAKSNDDLMMALLAMGMLGDQGQQQIPAQQLFQSDTDWLHKIFGNYFA